MKNIALLLTILSTLFFIGCEKGTDQASSTAAPEASEAAMTTADTSEGMDATATDEGMAESATTEETTMTESEDTESDAIPAE